MKTPFRCSLFSALLFLAPACASTESEHRLVACRQEPDDLAGISGAWIYGDIVIGGDPTAEALHCGQRRGYETVINLCGSEPIAYEPAEIEASGLRYIHLPMSGYVASDQQVDRVMAELAERTAGVLMHCSTGGRAAMMLAIYRAAVEGVEIEEAIEGAKQAGMKPSSEPESTIRTQVSRLLRQKPTA